MIFGDFINLWQVLIAAVLAYVFGGLWYGPLFGKYWMKLMGFTKSSMKKMPLGHIKAMTLGFVVILIASYVLANLVSLIGVNTFLGGLELTFWLWVGLSVPIILGSFIWETKSIRLSLFNGLHRFLEILIMVSIFAIW